MKPRGWDVASDVVNIMKGRNALRTPHRDGQPEEYDGSRALQPPRKDIPRPSAPRPAPAHSNSAPPGGYAGPGQQWQLVQAAQDSYPSYHDPAQAPQGYSSSQNTYRPPHNGYQTSGQQSQYQQQHDHNSLNYQNANQYGQSSPPGPGPDPGYPGYPGQNTHTPMNSGVQNQDPQSHYYGSTSHGQGQAYSQYPQPSSSDSRSLGGSATAPPDNVGHYGGTDYYGRTDEQRMVNGTYDDNPWSNERSYSNQPDHNGGSNDEWPDRRSGYN